MGLKESPVLFQLFVFIVLLVQPTTELQFSHSWFDLIWICWESKLGFCFPFLWIVCMLNFSFSVSRCWSCRRNQGRGRPSLSLSLSQRPTSGFLSTAEWLTHWYYFLIITSQSFMFFLLYCTSRITCLFGYIYTCKN